MTKAHDADEVVISHTEIQTPPLGLDTPTKHQNTSAPHSVLIYVHPRLRSCTEMQEAYDLTLNAVHAISS